MTRNPRFDTISDVEQFLALEPHWDDLCHRSGSHSFSQTFRCCSSAWTVVGHSREWKLCCLAGWLDDRLILTWPFVALRRGPWSMLRPLNSGTTEYSDVLVEDGPQADEWIALAWQKLRTTCNSDVIILPFVRTDSRLHRVVAQERPMSVWEIGVSGVSWDLVRDWESYYRSLKRDFRRSLKSRRRRLAEHGNLSFGVVTEGAQFPSTLDWLFQQKTEWLIRTERDSPWQDVQSYKNYLVELAAAGEGGEGVVLFVLKLDARIIAAVLGRLSRSTLEAVIAAYDRSYYQYGPGQLLYEDLLKWACQRRLVFDFRLGNALYKRYWTNRECKAISYRFINSAWGSAFALASRCRSGLQSLRNSMMRA